MTNATVVVEEEMAALAHWNESRIGRTARIDELLAAMFGDGELNRTVCQIQARFGDISGLYNFSWVSESELSFVTPCEETVPVTNWPRKGESYRMVTVINPDGRSSPTPLDVKLKHASIDLQMQGAVYVTDQCIEPGTMLLKDRCAPCPTTATCPGGGRVWPLPGQDFCFHLGHNYIGHNYMG